MASSAPAQQIETPAHHSQGRRTTDRGNRDRGYREDKVKTARRAVAHPAKGFVCSQTSHLPPDWGRGEWGKSYQADDKLNIARLLENNSHPDTA
eukprot:1593254-Pleurochrysis_carterae.AAC.1